MIPQTPARTARSPRLTRAAIIAALALGAATLASVPAMAEETQSTEIRHDDLDLTTLAGRTELDRRVTAAAQRLCRRDAAIGSRLVDRGETRACVAAVRRQVQSRLAFAIVR